MSVTDVFDIELDGAMSPARLDRFRKLLDLEPKGRLAEPEDEKFGHRALRDGEGERFWLGLWRITDESWNVNLWYEGPAPEHDVIDALRGEVLAAARELGFTVGRIRPEPAGPATVEPSIALPAGRALSVRMAGKLAVEARDTIGRILALHPENGGLSGLEYGWRYLRRDGTGRALVQLFFEDPDVTDVVLWYDGDVPDDDTVDGLRLQIGAVAAKAGLSIAAADPPPMPDEDTWERLGADAAGAANLDELWTRLSVPEGTALELRRGLLLAAMMSSAWTAPAPLLRTQALKFLTGTADPDGQWW
ncbi:MAG: hypothetical protein AUI14_21655 [Actinobacteria bacterium 13_2_20CM_2_71_6]|nr:MAG: hypothetical protein AUI14_21655 [Actinobacteria bacterium 13_2_20CM_2_71_6]